MSSLKKKLGKTGGFTLVEMLIVVAIIAILIAISIPLINSALEKARDNTDNANWRSAKAEATLLMLGVAENLDGTLIEIPTAITNYWYDAAKGVLTTDTPQAYGQCTKKHSGSGNDDPFASMTADKVTGTGTTNPETGPHVNMAIQLTINPTGGASAGVMPMPGTVVKWLTMAWANVA